MRASKFDAAELADLCRGFVADMLERAPNEIDPNSKFTRLGLDSAMSVQLIVVIEEAIGVELTPDVVGEYPTIARLAEYLARLCAERGMHE